MKITAKIISFFLMLCITLGTSFAFIFPASATDTPTLKLETIDKTDEEITVNIILENGSVNCIDVIFKLDGVICHNIEPGNAISLDGETLFASNPNAPQNSNFISIATNNSIKPGTLATVTLSVVEEEFSFEIEVSNCSVLVNDEEEFLSPIINGSVTSEDFATTVHVHEEVIITTPANCDSAGSIISYCLNCGETLSFENIPAKGHSAGTWVVTNEPTPTSKGTKVLYCAVCEEVMETAEIDKIPSDVREITVDNESINYKNSITLHPVIVADQYAEYTVTYSSSDTDIATIDENGEVYGAGRGTATITCTVTDSNGNTISDTCEITVTYTWWQWIIKIILLGFLWY